MAGSALDTDEYEEWMLESILLYKDLHVFELQDPSKVIEWIGEKSVCVAGYDHTKRNEILQLLVPQKLHAKEKQGLCPERDFKVEHGGFSEQPVYSLKHIPETSLLLTSGPAASPLQVWHVAAENKDVIKPISTIETDEGKETWTKIATTVSASPSVLHGSQVNCVHLTEIESTKRVYSLGLSSSDAVSTLTFLDCNTFLLCCLNGRQCIADVRQPRTAGECSAAPASSANAQWCAAVKPGKQEASSTIASLSSDGHVTLTDMRDLRAPLKCAMCCFSDHEPSGHFLCVSWAPALEDCLSISGFDGTVQIYDTQCWDGTLKEKEPLFTHKGHSVAGVCEDGSIPRITTHVWHPWKQRTVLSAATDGSLHFWDWTDSHTQNEYIP
ncbi:hypothetical protein FKM82_009929 [Ascaphus truei]